MRLKFRVWDKEENRMILPKYLYSIDLLKEQVTERTKCNYTFSLHSIPFDKVKFMQSTGLKDKNGKEIFEGDIVNYKGRKAIIKWHGSYASFIYRFVDELNKRSAEWYPLYLAYLKCEVIGNIYENPELLEAEG
jgi:hypothetical protein